VILSDVDYELFLAMCSDPLLYLYVLTCGETGARCESEVLRLRWEDIDHDGRFLKIVSGRDGHRTKTGKSRWVPMTPRIAEALRSHVEERRAGARSPWVFHHTRTRRHHKKGDRIKSMRGAWKTAARRATVPNGFHLHDLRHRRVTTWLAEGKNPVHVMEAIGHSDLRTTMAYAHLAREHLRSLVTEAGADPTGDSPASQAGHG
jgi:integrase